MLCSPCGLHSYVDRLTAQYSSVISDIMDEMAPMKTITVRELPQRQWYDDDCRSSRKEARRLERKFHADRKTGISSTKNSNKLSHSKSSSYWKNDAAGGNARRVWRVVDGLIGESKSSSKAAFTPRDYHDHIDAKIAGVRAATATAPPPVFEEKKSNLLILADINRKLLAI